ncbi:PriCT-2 domain-containing protein [Roseomonas sp. HF4]|uniref:PriCT-2 domain-containing protein n=1 Tax=Roseomonas sp. HF4 TaxID=2562313 RepID=UPI00197FC963|nr:PriCT-2 domain-containing protein [Roseomonas sp. HF4]
MARRHGAAAAVEDQPAQHRRGGVPRPVQAPKRLLVYRTATPFAGRKRHPLEVLARGQQFVAHAIHPTTGQPYSWPQDSLLDVPLASLPAVTQAQALAWLDRAYALLPEELKPRTLMGDSAPAGTWRGPSDPRGTFAAVQAALAFIPNDDLDGASWITMGAAIKAALGEEGRQLWLDWSRQAAKSGASGKGDTPERRWKTLRPHSIGAGSIYAMAIERGWVPPPEITLNAAAAERDAQPHPAAELLAKEANANQPVIAPAPYRVPPDLLQVDGALKMFVDYATRTAVSPQPFLALGAGLCLIGAVAGRRYRTPTDLRSNLYAIGIADSGGGKDHARRCAKRVLHAAGLERYLGGEDFASSAGLASTAHWCPSPSTWGTAPRRGSRLPTSRRRSTAATTTARCGAWGFT